MCYQAFINSKLIVIYIYIYIYIYTHANILSGFKYFKYIYEKYLA
jgi:hypothetical protein